MEIYHVLSISTTYQKIIIEIYAHVTQISSNLSYLHYMLSMAMIYTSHMNNYSKIAIIYMSISIS